MLFPFSESFSIVPIFVVVLFELKIIYRVVPASLIVRCPPLAPHTLAGWLVSKLAATLEDLAALFFGTPSNSACHPWR